MDEYLKGKEKGLFIDAGANIGQFSFYAASLGHIVYGFEPLSLNIELIGRTMKLNWDRKLHEKINLFQNGLSYKPSLATANVPHNNKGGTSLRIPRMFESEIQTLKLVIFFLISFFFFLK